jgi:hypothetical protein
MKRGLAGKLVEPHACGRVSSGTERDWSGMGLGDWELICYVEECRIEGF